MVRLFFFSNLNYNNVGGVQRTLAISETAHLREHWKNIYPKEEYWKLILSFSSHHNKNTFFLHIRLSYMQKIFLLKFWLNLASFWLYNF